MSKDRRRRREARERAAVPARAPRPSRPAGRRPKRRRQRAGGVLAAKRRQENLLLAAGLLLAHVVLWTQVTSWPARIVAVVLTLALWPIIVTVAFDRRSS